MFLNINFFWFTLHEFIISTISSCHFKLKLYGIVKLRTDFILLSDTRLNCEIRSQDVRTVNKTFLVNPYKSYNFFHNSLSNSRGVGILIKKSLNVSVSEVGHDEEGNILALKISTEGKSRYEGYGGEGESWIRTVQVIKITHSLGPNAGEGGNRGGGGGELAADSDILRNTAWWGMHDSTPGELYVCMLHPRYALVCTKQGLESRGIQYSISIFNFKYSIFNFKYLIH